MVRSTGVLASAWLFQAAYGATLTHAASTTASTASSQFTVPAAADVGANLIANIDDPQAINAQSACPGYKASDVHQDSNGLTATLKLAGKACNAYGTDVDLLDLSVKYLATDRLNVQITPTYLSSSNSSWFLLPEDLVPHAKADKQGTSEALNDFEISWTNEPSFGLKVTRKSNKDVLFDTTGSTLVFENQFIEFVTALPSDYNLYGIGEHIQQLRLLENATLTLYASDTGDPIDGNIYGSHPFYLDTRYYEVDGKGSHTLVSSDDADQSKDYVSYSHGVFMRNAHGQEVLTRSESLVWRAIGGSIDLTFYAGPTQADVTRDYQISTIGLPAMQQYFAFGYHQCRWGYQNWSVMDSVLSNFERFEIPLETLWNDIDYMKTYRDFDNDPIRFGYTEGEEFLQKLHDGGRHYVPIVDSAIYVPNPNNASDAYEPYTRGAEDSVFLTNPDGSSYIGAVWPGYTVFPDWHNPKARAYWANELVLWHQKIAFDGIWIDMSEVSSFCVGSCGSNNLTLNPVHPSFSLPGEAGNIIFDYPEGFNISNATEAASAIAGSSSQAAAAASTAGTESTTTTPYLRTTPTPGKRDINYPPYVINHDQTGHDLAVHAVSPNATHVDGVSEYDVHNLWGYQILNATYQGLLAVNSVKRPFIIGRSTFAGAGKWAGHWGGDNASKWAYMFFSIPQALSFSLFGIPMFGVDTCGFNGNSDEELCNRWMQLSAFFPFYRNHNELSTIGQEPYQWASVIDASKSAMKIRYAILPYFYTLFHLAHTTGSTVMRALAWEFPTDPSLATVDTQFLLGPSIMVIPVLEPQVDYVRGVFPGVKQGEIWYDWYNHTAVDAQPGVNTTISAPLGHIPVFVRGGSIIPMQEPALTTRDARNSPWSLLTSLDGSQSASGQLYLDDGESVTPSATLSVSFTASQSGISAISHGNWKDTNQLANVTVSGLKLPHAGFSTGKGSVALTLNGKKVSSASAIYNADLHILSITGLQSLFKGGAWDQNWVLKW
ncbi:Glycoside hydrolase family 31 [Penicillium verhagenii]|uniref:Glycoside hydrolase family 31 n=1 Tax=Penicillium verhagenii TaxID=1562060 RepID=UPI002544E6FE|nr:Glycoside hydrolase family 31 [Penicillium verhagenii]KAJ5928667.1 Glycoside hydrolase family 31 [Penicillium verhagenii]